MVLYELKVGPQVTRKYLMAVHDSADFIEIYAHPDYDYAVMSSWDKPVVVHVAHSDHGINFANPHKQSVNLAALHHAVSLANRYAADKIIFHPELLENQDCTPIVLTDFIRQNYDPRLHLENMPYSSRGMQHLAGSAIEMVDLLTKLNVKFCLDLAHATEYLTRTGTDRKYISDYLMLKPNHYHLTDTDLSKVFEPNYDEVHANFGDGTMDIAWLKSLIPQNVSVTLETPMDINKQLHELRIMRD